MTCFKARRVVITLIGFIVMAAPAAGIKPAAAQQPQAQSAKQNEFIEPGPNLEVYGIPPVPASLAKDINKYRNVFSLQLAGWVPGKREILLKGIDSPSYVTRLDKPGGAQRNWATIKDSNIYDVYCL